MKRRTQDSRHPSSGGAGAAPGFDPALGFPGGAGSRESASWCRRHETRVESLGQEDSLEKKVVTHSSVLTWRIHGLRSLAGYGPWGSKGDRHN